MLKSKRLHTVSVRESVTHTPSLNSQTEEAALPALRYLDAVAATVLATVFGLACGTGLTDSRVQTVSKLMRRVIIIEFVMLASADECAVPLALKHTFQQS